jgi:acetyltransferase-like isoleucine patch superfamily enzyme
MNKIIYYWSKFLKKFRGSAIKNSQIHKTSKIESGSQIVNTSFEKQSFCGYNCEIINCEIGSFCSIANNVIIGGGMHPIDWVSMSPVFYEGKDSVKAKFSEHKRNPPKKTVIGHDVWIGHSVIIKQGVNIGTGAVIGMGSVVTKDVEPYSIVAGCPAKEIKKRFDNETISELLETKWWTFNDEQLYKFAKYFTDPKMFIKEFRK